MREESRGREDDQGEVGEQEGPLELLGPDDIEGGVIRVHRAGAVVELPRARAETVGMEQQVGRDRVPEREPRPEEDHDADQQHGVQQEVREQGGHVSGSS